MARIKSGLEATAETRNHWHEAEVTERMAAGDVPRGVAEREIAELHTYAAKTYRASERAIQRGVSLEATEVYAPGRADEPFIEGARELFTAAASVAINSEEPTLGHTLRLLAPVMADMTDGDMDVAASMGRRFSVLASQATHASAQTTFLQYSAYDSKTIATYLSVVKSTGLGAWSDPAIDNATSANDFDLSSLRSKPQTIYIVISPNDMEALAPAARLFFQTATAALQSKMPSAGDAFPVLFVLDEFKALGRVDTMLNAATTLRGYGGRMLFVLQGVANIEEVYAHFMQAISSADLMMRASSEIRTPSMASRPRCKRA